MRTPPGCISPLAVLAVLATALLVGLGAARGGELFSPGELNAMAEIGRASCRERV